RARLPPAGSDMPLLLSGTAAVVGHASMHDGELLAQLEETFTNFDALVGAARAHDPGLPARFGGGTRLKVYVRDRHDLPLVAEALERRFGDAVPRILLHAAICRRELAVEIDGVHGAPRACPGPRAARPRGRLQRHGARLQTRPGAAMPARHRPPHLHRAPSGGSGGGSQRLWRFLDSED